MSLPDIRMSLPDMALAYAARGWQVFPIKPGLKIPATRRGFLDATTDTETIRGWWSNRYTWPRRNIGVVTSQASNLWVLDCDIDSETGEFGEDTLNELIGRHGALPPHPISRTPKGGRHHLFAWPDDGGDVPRRIKFLPGLDALGARDGKAGYFIAPPSVRQDGAYEWEVDLDVGLPQAPAWLLALIRDGVREAHVGPALPVIRSDATTPYGRKALTEECARLAACPPGSQYATLGHVAVRIGSIAAGGSIEPNEARSAVTAAAMQMRNLPGREPWSPATIDKQIATGLAKGALSPTYPPKRQAEHHHRQAEHRRPEPPPQTEPHKQETPPPRGARPQLIVTNEVLRKPEPQKPPEVSSVSINWMAKHDWIWKDDDVLQPTAIKNVQLMIEFHPDLAGMFRYDAFKDQVVIANPVPTRRGVRPSLDDGYPRVLADEDEAAIAAWLNWYGLTVGISIVSSMIREVASRNKFDPLKSWLDGLVWDGEPRISRWLTTYAGAKDDTYTSLVGTKFLIGAAARAFSPGEKVDTMLIFEGPQGLKKSTAVAELCGPEWFSDQVGDVTSKDSSERIHGRWIVEIPEMDKFSRTEANAVKDFLSRREDRYRPAFGRNVVNRKRRCVFFGTINPDGVGYLKDTTGNRRFWPVAVTKINLDTLKHDREQIWAEAVDRYRTGEEWWISDIDEPLVQPQQEARRDDDVWEPAIEKWLAERLKEVQATGSKTFLFTSSECLRAMGIDLGKQGQREKIRVAKILKMMGCNHPNNAGGIKGRSWEFGG